MMEDLSEILKISCLSIQMIKNNFNVENKSMVLLMNRNADNTKIDIPHLVPI